MSEAQLIIGWLDKMASDFDGISETLAASPVGITEWKIYDDCARMIRDIVRALRDGQHRVGIG